VLENINSPKDLKNLKTEELGTLCGEIREELIKTISKNGGHLASNLGTVELTVALHRCFDSPKDKIIFDVGHQCYTHKILTGRKDKFATIRTEGGLSGFTRPEESEHDVFVSGHSSTSISAALGLTVANHLKNDDGYVIAIIGDGALTGGLAYEALNNASSFKGKLIVVLNDNKMSISKNVGAMSRHLAVIRSRPSYLRFKIGLDVVLSKIPLVGKPTAKMLRWFKTRMKNLLYSSTIFEDMGFAYLGPVDGHDINVLENCFEMAKTTRRPPLIHICTVKGKGYHFAEQTPQDYHGVSSGMDIDTGECAPAANSFSFEFGKDMCDIAKENEKVCAITAAMCEGVGLSDFAKQYPKRFFDVGIAEEHAVTFCSGLAKGGYIPVLAVYSSFLQRGYDQLIHDVAIQDLPCVICVDRAGFVGEDGETHQGIFDVPYLNSIPKTTVYSPSCYAQLKCDLKRAMSAEKGLQVVRYPRGKQPYIPEKYTLSYDADYQVFGDNSDIAIITYGRVSACALTARDELQKDGVSVDVIALNRIRPIPEDAIIDAMNRKNIFFFEEGSKYGGVAERFSSILMTKGYKGNVSITAVEEEFVPQSSVNSALAKYKLDSNGIVNVVKSFLKGNNE